MKAMLGEEGTEQFTVETRVDGEAIKVQPIHDPFIHTTIVTGLSRWSHFKAIFRPHQIRIAVILRGSEAAQRAIMTLDPFELSRESEQILHERRNCREASGDVMGCEIGEMGGTVR